MRVRRGAHGLGGLGEGRGVAQAPQGAAGPAARAGGGAEDVSGRARLPRRLVAAEPMVQKPDLLRVRSRRPDLGGRVSRLHARPAGTRRGRSDLPRRRARGYRWRRAGGQSTVFLDRLVMPRSFAFVKGGILCRSRRSSGFARTPMATCAATKRTEVGTHAASPAIRSTPRTAFATASTTGCTTPTGRSGTAGDGRLIEEDTVYARAVRRHFRRDGPLPDVLRKFARCTPILFPPSTWCAIQALRSLPARAAPTQRVRRECRTSPCERAGGFSRSGSRPPSRSARWSCVTMAGCAPTLSRGHLPLRRAPVSRRRARQCLRSGIGRPSRRSPEAGGGIAARATRFYPAEQEFLASTDERFRPVNAASGPTARSTSPTCITASSST